MTAEMQQELIYTTETFIGNKVGLIQEENKEAYMGKCYFNRLLRNWLDFDFEQKFTKYDSMVAAGFALFAARKDIRRKKNRETIKLFEEYTSGAPSQHTKIPSGRLRQEKEQNDT
jgi:hypothetical protein